MGYKTKEDVMKRVQEHYDAAIELYGDKVLGVFLQGSWNYGKELCDEQSDVDTKCIVLPSFEDVCLNEKPVSCTHILENEEHLDAKDLRLYMNCFRKQNVNFVEILFTEYAILNPKYEEQWARLVKARERIGRYDTKRALQCIVGMALEKDKALCHPYPTLIEKINKYGYDGKQLSHVCRLAKFMELYMAGFPYDFCLSSGYDKSFLQNLRHIKRHISDRGVEWAKQYSKDLCERLKIQKDEWIEQNYNEETESKRKQLIDELLNDVVVECMKISFKGEL